MFTSLDLKKHVASQHEKFKAMKCEKCGYSCTKASYMTNHIASVHEKGNLASAAVVVKTL